MSTRCQILVDGCTAVVYRHSDGYPDGPSGVLAGLLPLVKQFMAVRGEDPDYLAAQIVHHMLAAHHKWAKSAKKERAKRGDSGGIYDQVPFIGYGIEAFGGTFHGDLAFVYVVKRDRVEVRKTNSRFWDAPTMANAALVAAVDFDGNPIHAGAALTLA